ASREALVVHLAGGLELLEGHLPEPRQLSLREPPGSLLHYGCDLLPRNVRGKAGADLLVSDELRRRTAERRDARDQPPAFLEEPALDHAIDTGFDPRVKLAPRPL